MMTKATFEFQIETGEVNGAWIARLPSGVQFERPTQADAVRAAVLHCLGASILRLNSVPEEHIVEAFKLGSRVAVARPKIEVVTS